MTKAFLLYAGMFLLAMSPCQGQQVAAISSSEEHEFLRRIQAAIYQVEAASAIQQIQVVALSGYSAEDKLAAFKLILDDTTINLEVRYAAAVAMAKLRTPDAMRGLFERIDLKMGTIGGKNECQPISDAFVELGKPAIPFLLNFIENSESETKISSAVKAVVEIEAGSSLVSKGYDDFLLANKTKFSAKLFSRLVRYAVN